MMTHAVLMLSAYPKTMVSNANAQLDTKETPSSNATKVSEIVNFKFVMIVAELSMNVFRLGINNLYVFQCKDVDLITNVQTLKHV